MDEKIFTLLEKMYAEFNDFREETNGKFDSLSKEVKQNSNHILRLEDKVENKLGALFDNREVTNEKLDAIDTKVDTISSDLSIIKMITTKNWNDIDFLKRAK